MAKSTRQYIFEGMEVLPEALVPFVEKRLEGALTSHWQVRVAEKLRVQVGLNGDIAWDQAVRSTMRRCRNTSTARLWSARGAARRT